MKKEAEKRPILRSGKYDAAILSSEAHLDYNDAGLGDWSR